MKTRVQNQKEDLTLAHSLVNSLSGPAEKVVSRAYLYPTRRNQMSTKENDVFNKHQQEIKMEHTPTPWRRELLSEVNDPIFPTRTDSFIREIHLKNENSLVLAISYPNTDAGRNNVDFVLRAINLHEALLEVKQRAIDLADVVKNGGNYKRAVEWLEEAIAQAGGN